MSSVRVSTTIARDLAATPGVRAALVQSAEPARARADLLARQARAPWMRRKSARFTVVIESDQQGVRLVNTDYGGHLMEFGSANNPPHAPLRRGARAAGLRLDETP